MLARSFKTAADLGISEIERDALIKVLGMLERGEIADSQFAMRDWDCGTTACICGWARRVGGKPVFPAVAGSDPTLKPGGLFRLFGGHNSKVINCQSPSQAAHALSNYLTTGEPRWDLALAEDAR